MWRRVTYSHSKFYGPEVGQSVAAVKAAEHKRPAEQVPEGYQKDRRNPQGAGQGHPNRSAGRGKPRAERQDDPGVARADYAADGQN